MRTGDGAKQTLVDQSATSGVEPEPELLAGAGAGIAKFRLRLPAPGQL
jgi:hypothetical protein